MSYRFCRQLPSRIRMFIPDPAANFSNLFWKWNSTCFRQFLCPSSGVIHCKHSNGVCHTGFVDSIRANFSNLFWKWNFTCFGHFLCTKHVEFHLKKNWEISASIWFYYKEICHDARSHECKTQNCLRLVIPLPQWRVAYCVIVSCVHTLLILQYPSL
jgi:hypothetical protein